MPTIGEKIVAHRKDGRVFAGFVDNVKSTSRGTMVVVKSWREDGDYDDSGRYVHHDSPEWKTVYLEECSAWDSE